ncbi:uncharacterized protein FIBRA_01933 [Fibroporia radiculosa]|uniref:Uncharacterized protein n=1 Tax=Fibroporia radiculosa TaxID=599839 RepID=J4G194_9APHY|nr:uncharacterized protein FIBRA_01933 [Fibroporia radiculosa]CCL99908.1 predicted protein [Fibroporia radiculosa]
MVMDDDYTGDAMLEIAPAARNVSVTPDRGYEIALGSREKGHWGRGKLDVEFAPLPGQQTREESPWMEGPFWALENSSKSMDEKIWEKLWEEQTPKQNLSSG